MKKPSINYMFVIICFLILILISCESNAIHQMELESLSIIYSPTGKDDISLIKNDVIFWMSYDGEIKGYSLDDLKDFEVVTGTGGRLKVTGDISGPYEYTGVSITVLIHEFSNVPNDFDILTISNDGFLTSFSYNQVKGNVMVYDEEGNEQGVGGVNMILAYEEDDQPLEFGGPLRIAWVNDEDAITDAFLWPKFIEEIEIIRDSEDTTPPIVNLMKPDNAIYFFNKKIISYAFPLIIGHITIEIDASDQESGISQLMILINDQKKVTFTNLPYRWDWDEHVMGSYTISISCYDGAGNIASAQKNVNIFNFF